MSQNLVTHPSRRQWAGRILIAALVPFVTLALVGCGGSKGHVKKRSLADQLAGENRTVTEGARGLIVSLPDILFDFDKATLKPEVESTLMQVADVLKQYPGLKIQVEGHTDNKGSDEYNQDLSERRSSAVFEFLVSEGIDASQMIHSGFGESTPVATNDTEEGRARNRRVDLVIPDVPDEAKDQAAPDDQRSDDSKAEKPKKEKKKPTSGGGVFE